MKTDRFYWAIINPNGRLLPETVSSKAAMSRGLMVARYRATTWEMARKKGFRAIKVTISEFQP
jgi:hypothetical protein